MSYWPRTAAWKGRGLDLGYWTSKAECWFQMQLSHLKNGEYAKVVKKASDWTHALKYSAKDSQQLVLANDTQAEHALLAFLSQGRSLLLRFICLWS